MSNVQCPILFIHNHQFVHWCLGAQFILIHDNFIIAIPLLIEWLFWWRCFQFRSRYECKYSPLLSNLYLSIAFVQIQSFECIDQGPDQHGLFIYTNPSIYSSIFISNILFFLYNSTKIHLYPQCLSTGLTCFRIQRRVNMDPMTCLLPRSRDSLFVRRSRPTFNVKRFPVVCLLRPLALDQ